MKRLPMRKIRDVLRLSTEGLSTRQISASLSIGRTTLQGYLERARLAGVSWPLPETLTDTELEQLLYPRSAQAVSQRATAPNWAEVHRELRRKGVTLRLLWEEYRTDHPEGYGYSRFCDLYRRWEEGCPPVMRQCHQPGNVCSSTMRGRRLMWSTRRPVRCVQRSCSWPPWCLELYLCRGHLDAEPAGLDREPRARLYLLRRCRRPGGAGQPEVRRDQGVFL